MAVTLPSWASQGQVTLHAPEDAVRLPATGARGREGAAGSGERRS
ncbi:hypothetical protein GCM10019016_072690 [Streptomyces prasinosporus]|uniref:Uncharacterized protein n=1 Tax=Streptomyces prasinosporus TaxID=68256 RepID=A0ABP6U0C4_9ACTN